MRKCTIFIVVALLLFSGFYVFKRVDDRKFRALPTRTEIPNLGVWKSSGSKSAPQEVIFQLVAPARISQDGRAFEGLDAVNKILAQHGVEKIKELSAPGHYVAIFKNDIDVDVKTIAGELAKTEGIKYAEPNYAFSSLD